ncbi:c-type cytochrome [Marinigracilibium pacificum]|uniref:Cytochrome c n=1 Tax=Marinigracilibium pacificum TaxID=2729599 RepID=A0A848J326_9BACT|nr:cytochrome c [Marinigracilibium pacificum]NMM50156.1 cytochrome c [Marinigracilibium pacificum]
MMSSIKKYFYALVAIAILASCAADGNDPGVEYAPQMYHTIPYEPLTQIQDKEAGAWLTSSGVDSVAEFYNSNPYNEHKMTMRLPAENTVRYAGTAPMPYEIHKDSFDLAGRTLKNPLDSTQAIVQQGRALYERFCQHCHGPEGKGGETGTVGKVYPGITGYSSISVKDKPAGHIFHVITHGKGRMGAHGSQLNQEERWKIVRYVQILQKK